MCCAVLRPSVVSNSLWPHGLQPASCPALQASSLPSEPPGLRKQASPLHLCISVISGIKQQGWSSWSRWTIKKAEHRRTDAFELWCWRRLLRILWTAKRSIQSILKKISLEYSLEGLMLKLKLQNFGHLMRRTDSLEKILMLGKIEGRRRRGQQRRWLDSITSSRDMSLSKHWELVMDREAWHAAVHGVTKSQTQLSYWTELNPDLHDFLVSLIPVGGFPGGSDSKESANSAKDLGSIPGSGRSPKEGNGNSLQYSCLENPMNGGAWQATVHGVSKSQTQLSDFTFFPIPDSLWYDDSHLLWDVGPSPATAMWSHPWSQQTVLWPGPCSSLL